MGIDVGSISTKGVIIDKKNHILASRHIWTQGDPIGAVKELVRLLEGQYDKESYKIVATGTTGSARKLVGAVLGATMVKNEITAHAVGTTTFYPDVRTILEIGGQDSKIILVENGVAVDYAMNTLCAAGTGAFLSSQAKRLGIEVEEIGEYALRSTHPTHDCRPVHSICRIGSGPQNPDGPPQRGYHRRGMQRGGGQLPEQRGQGQEDPLPGGVSGGVSKNQGWWPPLSGPWAARSLSTPTAT